MCYCTKIHGIKETLFIRPAYDFSELPMCTFWNLCKVFFETSKKLQMPKYLFFSPNTKIKCSTLTV